MSGIPVYTESPLNNASKPSGTTPQTLVAKTHSEVSSVAAGTTSTASDTPMHPGPTPFSIPTPTTKSVSDGPSPPQPGAFPMPLSTGIPPPPKAGEKYPPAKSMPQPYPPQMRIPPPSTPFSLQPPASSTTTSTTASSKFPVSIPAAEYEETKKGYHQDTYASELTNDQRRAQNINNLTGQEDTSNNNGTESVWNTAKKWASSAAEAEAGLWRRINKES